MPANESKFAHQRAAEAAEEARLAQRVRELEAQVRHLEGAAGPGGSR